MLSRLSSKKILMIFVLSLYCLLLGFKLLRLGKHGDGIEYASVARNLADGVGTFWKPYLDDYLHPVFHEHPPFVFWLQSLHCFIIFVRAHCLTGMTSQTHHLMSVSNSH